MNDIYSKHRANQVLKCACQERSTGGEVNQCMDGTNGAQVRKCVKIEMYFMVKPFASIGPYMPLMKSNQYILFLISLRHRIEHIFYIERFRRL